MLRATVADLRVVREHFVPRSRFYVLGNSESRFALLRYDERRYMKPKGGIVIGRWGLWWSR
jgi:hypothetical protein